MKEKNYKHIVRVANADLDGSKPVYLALTKVKGIGRMYANMVCFYAGIDRNTKVGTLPDDSIDKIEEVIQNPDKYKCPEWMYNRRNDINDGKTKHLVSADLKFTQENDVRRMQKTKSYKGVRHAMGLPVRGQRTKSNFRRNKGKVVGVKKKKGAKSGRV